MILASSTLPKIMLCWLLPAAAAAVAALPTSLAPPGLTACGKLAPAAAAAEALLAWLLLLLLLWLLGRLVAAAGGLARAEPALLLLLLLPAAEWVGSCTALPGRLVGLVVGGPGQGFK
jgi:hypothetical protein